MDKLTKYTESFCEDCQLGIKLENCRACLFNVLCRKDGEKSDGGTNKRA